MNEYILRLSCEDQPGIVAGVTSILSENGFNILELSQFSDPSTSQFFMRIDFDTGKRYLEEEAIFSLFDTVSKKFQMDLQLHDKKYRPKVLIMVSKQSHCLNHLLHQYENGTLPIEIPAIVSNHQDLKQMASWYHIPFYHFPVTKQTKADQEKQLVNLIIDHKVDIVVLARYMQILSSELCTKLQGKAINIHHSFLPSFKGAKPYHQAYARGVKVIGATAHYVTADLDEGPIIEQETVRVRHDYNPEKLIQLGYDVECFVLARALKYQIEQRIFLNQSKTVVFN